MTSASLLHRGRVTGSLLILLGIWGAIIPFVGPYLHYAYTPDRAWAYTSGRLFLSVLPGAAVFLGGLLVVVSDVVAIPGALLAVLGGAWFVVGQPVTATTIGTSPVSPGSPVASPAAAFGATTMRFLEGLGFFYGLGVLVVFLAALALGEVFVARLAARHWSDRVDSMETEDEYGPAF